MEIFGRHIFGSDAQEFIDLCFEDQVQWIKKYTNQRDKEQIKLLLSNLLIGKVNECLDCKEKRESYGRNISKTVPTEVADNNKQAILGGNNVGDNTKRSSIKTRKDKRIH
jgi:hypothetical protein